MSKPLSKAIQAAQNGPSHPDANTQGMAAKGKNNGKGDSPGR
jgi:hypothetical protein